MTAPATIRRPRSPLCHPSAVRRARRGTCTAILWSAVAPSLLLLRRRGSIRTPTPAAATAAAALLVLTIGRSGSGLQGRALAIRGPRLSLLRVLLRRGLPVCRAWAHGGASGCGCLPAAWLGVSGGLGAGVEQDGVANDALVVAHALQLKNDEDPVEKDTQVSKQQGWRSLCCCVCAATTDWEANMGGGWRKATPLAESKAEA